MPIIQQQRKSGEIQRNFAGGGLGKIRKEAFEICAGFYTRKAPLLYGIFLKAIAELKDLIGKESFINKPDNGEWFKLTEEQAREVLREVTLD